MRNLKQGLQHGLVLKKVYRIIEFNLKAWLKSYRYKHRYKKKKKCFRKIFF